MEARRGEPSYRILGPLDVRAPDGQQIELPSVSQRRLLSILLMRANQIVPSAFVEETLALSPGGLRTAISRLRKTIATDSITTSSPGYLLSTESVDALEFVKLAAEQRFAGG